MDVFEAITVALTGILANKMRSVLTMLGVIIGVGAVIVTTAIGEGLKQDTLDRIRSMGSNLLSINPGTSHHGSGLGVGMQTLKLEDGEALAKGLPDVKRMAPEVSRSAPG
jgi:putative ABC transport system permease protein